MVAPFTLKRIDETGSEILYTADNITSLTMDCNTPVAPMPLPQEEDKENILIKVEGNTTTVTLSWKIKNPYVAPNGDFTSPFQGTPSNTAAEACNSALTVISYFKDNFVPVTINEKYELLIADELLLRGTLMKLSFTVSGSSPVVWDGHMQFIHGNVAASNDGDYAGQPDYSTIVDASAVNSIQINDASTDYFGVDTGITGYKVQYKEPSSSTWTSVTYSTTDPTDQDFVVSVGGTGTFDVKFTAITTTNSENVYTVPISVTVS